MPSAVAALLQIFNSSLSRRLTRVLFWGLLGLWLFDRIIFLLTDYQWFASLGYQDLLIRQWSLEAEIFGLFFGACLLLTIAVMRTVHKPAGDEEPRPLARSLRRLEPVRVRALRWSWCILLIWAALLARSLSRQWSAWLEFRNGESTGFKVPHYGLDAGFWVHQLPFLERLLSVCWRFSLVLFLLALVTGVVRSLSLVASRQPVTPARFNRTLVGLTIWLLTLRALGYGLAAFSVARERFDAAGLFLARPLDAIGATACLMLAIVVLTHHKPTSGNFWWPGWKFLNRVLAVLLLPPILDFCLTPLWNRLTPPGTLDAARAAASTRAWHLDFPAYAPEKAPLPEQVWPIWDEAHVLQAIQGRLAGGQKADWRMAEIQTPASPNGRWEAIVAGPVASRTVAQSSASVDGNNILIARVALPSTVDKVDDPELMSLNGPLLFGYEGRTLVTDSSGQTASRTAPGIDARSWWTKLTWSWRLRDAFLPGEAASASNLIIFRGVEECTQRLVPHLVPEGPPHLQIVDRRPYWVLNLLKASNNFPGSYQPESGNLQGVNTAQYAGTFLMDAANGHIWFSAAGREGVRATALSPELPLQIRDNFQPSLREAQAQVLAQATHSELLSTSVPLHLGAGLERAIVLAGKGTGHVLFERSLGGVSQVATWPISSDIREQLRTLTEALNGLNEKVQPTPSREGVKLELSSPIVWPDAQAPGGWWVGQAYYLVPDLSVTLTPEHERYTRLQSMAIAGATGEPGLGRSWNEAVVEWQANQHVVPVPGDSQASTEQLSAAALRLHESALKEFSKPVPDYVKLGQLLRDEGEILRKLAGRK